MPRQADDDDLSLVLGGLGGFLCRRTVTSVDDAVGLMLGHPDVHGFCTVVDVHPNSPAAKAGVECGEKLYKMNGTLARVSNESNHNHS